MSFRSYGSFINLIKKKRYCVKKKEYKKAMLENYGILYSVQKGYPYGSQKRSPGRWRKKVTSDLQLAYQPAVSF